MSRDVELYGAVEALLTELLERGVSSDAADRVRSLLDARYGGSDEVEEGEFEEVDEEDEDGGGATTGGATTAEPPGGDDEGGGEGGDSDEAGGDGGQAAAEEEARAALGHAGGCDTLGSGLATQLAR